MDDREQVAVAVEARFAVRLQDGCARQGAGGGIPGGGAGAEEELGEEPLPGARGERPVGHEAEEGEGPEVGLLQDVGLEPGDVDRKAREGAERQGGGPEPGVGGSLRREEGRRQVSARAGGDAVVRVASREAGGGGRSLERRLGDAGEGEDPHGRGRTGGAVEERPREATGRRVEPQLVERGGERVLEVPGQEPLGDLGPLPGDPVDPGPVDGSDELGELERERLLGQREGRSGCPGCDRLRHRRQGPGRRLALGGREEDEGRRAPEPRGRAPFRPFPQVLEEPTPLFGKKGLDEEGDGLGGLDRRRLAVGHPCEPFQRAAGVVPGAVEVPRGGGSGKKRELGPVGARRPRPEPLEAAELLDDPGGGERVRPLLQGEHRSRDLREPVVEPDRLHPVEAEEPSVGKREDLAEGAQGHGLREAPRAVVDLGHGERLSPVLAFPARGRPYGDAEDTGAPGKGEAGPPLATGVEGIGDEDGPRAVEPDHRVAPRAGEERGDPASPRPELWRRGAADPSPHLRFRGRPGRSLPVRCDADDVEAPRGAPQDPDFVPEEGGLRAPQRSRRDGGADRAVGKAEDVPGLHAALVSGAGGPATEAVRCRGGDAGARVRHAEDVALVADRERGLLEAPGIAQDEPAGIGLDRPDESARGHPETRLDPASGLRGRGRPESKRGEDGGREGERDGPETVSEGRHWRERAYPPGRIPVPCCVATP